MKSIITYIAEFRQLADYLEHATKDSPLTKERWNKNILRIAVARRRDIQPCNVIMTAEDRDAQILSNLLTVNKLRVDDTLKVYVQDWDSITWRELTSDDDATWQHHVDEHEATLKAMAHLKD